jgi:spore coat protein U-like protein
MDTPMRGAKSLSAAKFGLGLVAAAATIPSMAQAQTVSGDAQIAIVRPLSFIQVENMDFGRIIPSGTAGTVTLSTTNVRTATNGIVLVGNDHQPGRFAGMGTVLQRVRVRITPNTITLTGPGPSMTVNNVTVDSQGTLLQIGNSQNYFILPLNGIFWFNVGGRLNVGANQPAGAYSGTFNATLDYQ